MLPHPPRRLPLLGDVVGVKPNTPVQSTLGRIRDLGPISVRKVLGTEVVTVGGAELAGELADETRFCKFVGLHLPPLRRIVGDALFTAENDEPNWQLAHDILAPAFTRDAMSGYHPTMVAVARELLARWDLAADRGERVDVSSDMTRLTMETIGRAGFGYRFASFESKRPHRFVIAMTRALRHSRFSAVIPWGPVRRVLGSSDAQYLRGRRDNEWGGRRGHSGASRRPDVRRVRPAGPDVAHGPPGDRRPTGPNQHPPTGDYLHHRRPRNHLGCFVVRAVLPDSRRLGPGASTSGGGRAVG